LLTDSGREFIIQQDLPEIGWYLYVYENGKCTKDYLQDNQEMAMKQAKDDFGIQKEQWIEIAH
jgi:hypothetical protein